MLGDFPMARGPAPDVSLPGVSLRTAIRADLRFVQLLQAELREGEFAALPLATEQKRALIDSQVRAQHVYYTTQYPDADFWIIDHEGLPAGLLYLDRNATDWRVIHIALSSDFRGRGWGAALIGWVREQAAAAGKGTALTVAFNNPRARELYRRLGFAETAPEDDLPFIEMAWRPA